jgi:hypothetical protein
VRLDTEPCDTDRLDPTVLADRRLVAANNTIEHLQLVVARCVFRLHELGDHAEADDAEQLARSGF